VKFCLKHWDELRVALEATSTGPATASVAAMQLAAERGLSGGEPNLYKLQETIEAKGGCMVCYFGQTFLPDLIARLKDGRLPLKSQEPAG
jgi:hypothetical protein